VSSLSMAEDTSGQQWHLSPGDSILRRELHRLTGAVAKAERVAPARARTFSYPSIALSGAPTATSMAGLVSASITPGTARKGISSSVQAMLRSFATEKMVGPSGSFRGWRPSDLSRRVCG
jgi:hypothetical protein